MNKITSANKEIQLGDIFNINKKYQYYRVLLCDKYKVYYQGLVLYNYESEILKVEYNPSKFVGMNSMSTNHFKSQAFPFVERKPLSEKEYKMLRPDLPLIFGRSKLLSWKSINLLPSFENLFDYGEEFKKELSFDRIYIRTYGKDGVGKKIFSIDSGKSGKMNAAEIVWRSAQYQVEVFEDDRYGISIYRVETQKGYPLYILSGYYGRGTLILSVELGTRDENLATIGIPVDKVRCNVLSVKKKGDSLYELKILNEEIPVKGTVFKLFLKWHNLTLMEFEISSEKFEVDLKDYPPGTYCFYLVNSKKGICARTNIEIFHLIRDDYDGWVYIYPDMKNITQYSKKIEEPKKIVIPKFRASTSMKKHEKKLKELLADEKIQGRGEIMDMEEHGFQLHYFDLNETDSHFDALSEQGFQGGGPTWYGIVSGAIHLADPTLNDEIYIDDDSEGIIISSKSKAVLEKMSRMIGILKSEPELLSASIHIAEKNEMID